jgi:hypothetical protein
MQQTQRRNSSKRVLVRSRPVTGLQPTNEGDSARPEALHRFLGPTSVPTLSCSCLASFRRSARHLPLLSRSVACHKRAHPGPVATRLHEREQCQARQSRPGSSGSDMLHCHSSWVLQRARESERRDVPEQECLGFDQQSRRLARLLVRAVKLVRKHRRPWAA